MPKRSATNQLNHPDWSHEDDADEEECTTPQIASPEVMSKRIIRTGKRRIAETNPSAAGKSAFSNFSGFGNSTPSPGTDTKSPFSFLSNSNSTFSNVNGLSGHKNDEESRMNHINKSTNNDSEYFSKLKVLNESVLEWIKIHVSKNPTCILTPVFNDYDKHLKDLKKEKNSKEQNENKTEPNASNNATGSSLSSPKPFFSNNMFSANFDSSKDTSPKSELSTKVNEASSSLIPGLNPLVKPPAFKNDSQKSIFSLPVSSPSSLGDSKPSIFANAQWPTPGLLAPPTTTTSANQNQEEEAEEGSEPPQNVFEKVTEEDAVFSQRVKLFLKKTDDFVDNGVGTLYIKPVDSEGSKYQAIVRADTSLGNILLNIILKDSIPSKRVGKNNVMLGCVLEVDKTLKPVPVLLRVKTESDADNLLEKIKKYTK